MPHRTAHCSALAALIAAALGLICAMTGDGRAAPAAPAMGAARRASLYVYLHTDAKSAALEEILRNRLRGLDVTVFGRFPDFDQAMRQRAPDAVLARQVLLTNRRIPVKLQGLRSNSDREPYLLVGNGSVFDGSPAGRVIGVVDLLGRAGTEDHYAKVLRTVDLTLKRVTKREDLLPLLQFGLADAALVHASALKNLRERTQMPLKARVLNDIHEGLPAVGVLTDAFRALVVQQFEALDGETNRLLEVDRWKAP